jgi:predicted ATPase
LANEAEQKDVRVALKLGEPFRGLAYLVRWDPKQPFVGITSAEKRSSAPIDPIREAVTGIRVYALDARAIASSAAVQPRIELGEDGSQLASVLDDLRDTHPDRFQAINDSVGRWLPEFRAILFQKPGRGQKSVLLESRAGDYRIPAADLSQGTLLALAMLTLAFLPHPPPLVGLEEPDRGIHPRLLRHVADAIHRLSHPKEHGEDRQPVQVIATTHSPYFLDLFKDHPEEVVIAEKTREGARFERLSDRSDIGEILADAPLGEVWYTGVLGGVPTEP